MQDCLMQQVLTSYFIKRTHIALFVSVFNTGDAVGIENENDDICHIDEKE